MSNTVDLILNKPKANTDLVKPQTPPNINLGNQVEPPEHKENLTEIAAPSVSTENKNLVTPQIAPKNIEVPAPKPEPAPVSNEVTAARQNAEEIKPGTLGVDVSPKASDHISNWDGALMKLKILEQQQMADHEKEEKRLKNKRLFSALGDGLSSLANLYFTTQYAPDMSDGKGGQMSANTQAALEKLKELRKKDRDKYFNAYKDLYGKKAAEQKERERLDFYREKYEDQIKGQNQRNRENIQSKESIAANKVASGEKIAADKNKTQESIAAGNNATRTQNQNSKNETEITKQTMRGASGGGKVKPIYGPNNEPFYVPNWETNSQQLFPEVLEQAVKDGYITDKQKMGYELDGPTNASSRALIDRLWPKSPAAVAKVRAWQENYLKGQNNASTSSNKLMPGVKGNSKQMPGVK